LISNDRPAQEAFDKLQEVNGKMVKTAEKGPARVEKNEAVGRRLERSGDSKWSLT